MDSVDVFTLDDKCKPLTMLVRNKTWDEIAELFQITDEEYEERMEPLEDPGYGRCHFLGTWGGNPGMFVAVNNFVEVV